MNADLVERVLVDTNVASWIGAGRGRHAEWAAALVGRRPFVSFITVGEILRGGIMAGWSEAKVGEWERRLRVYTVTPGLDPRRPRVWADRGALPPPGGRQRPLDRRNGACI